MDRTRKEARTWVIDSLVSILATPIFHLGLSVDVCDQSRMWAWPIC